MIAAALSLLVNLALLAFTGLAVLEFRKTAQTTPAVPAPKEETTATIYLETGDGHEIRVQKSHEELASLPLQIGQELVAYWNEEDGHLVPEE